MTDEDEVVEEGTASYIITQTRKIRVDAPSAAEARKTAETLFQLKPDSKLIETIIHTEKQRH